MTEKQTTSFDDYSRRVELLCEQDVHQTIMLFHAWELIEELLQEAFRDAEHRTEYMDLIAGIKKTYNWSSEDFGREIGSLGMKLYDAEHPELSHWVYQQAVAMNPTQHAMNNLAYISRHHRDVLNTSGVQIIDLLIEGVKSKEPFSLINMALVFGQMLGEEADWLLADRMSRLIDSGSVGFRSAVKWWSDLAEAEDPEGYLVLQWLKRNGKFTRMLPVDMELNIMAFRSESKDIPSWIFEKWRENQA